MTARRISFQVLVIITSYVYFINLNVRGNSKNNRCFPSLLLHFGLNVNRSILDVYTQQIQHQDFEQQAQGPEETTPPAPPPPGLCRHQPERSGPRTASSSSTLPPRVIVLGCAHLHPHFLLLPQDTTHLLPRPLGLKPPTCFMGSGLLPCPTRFLGGRSATGNHHQNLRSLSLNHRPETAQASTSSSDVPPALGTCSMMPRKYPRTNNVISVDMMVSIDACFMQKKKKSSKDPLKYHPNTHFVPEDLAAKTEAYIDSVHNTSDKNLMRRKRQARDFEEEEDGYDHEDLLLPRSILDGCEASFKVADEKCEKASTEFFEDTGLMALLCHHDCVLWIINNHSAGEKQFGVILLTERLFEHLPRKIRIGILYNIGCLLERSCLKWGFLSRWINQIVFAVMSGHASCYIIPGNAEDSTYCNRLYMLDAQIKHMDEMSLLRLGQWVSRRYAHSIQKCAEATKAFREYGKSQMLLREQWKLQILAQTKPLPHTSSLRRAKNHGEKAVNSVILLRSAVTAHQGLVRNLCQKFLDGVMEDDPEAAMYKTEFKAAEEVLRKLTELLRWKEAVLGIDEQQELQLHAYPHEHPHPQDSPVAASAFQTSCPHVSTVKHRESTITKLAGEYNKLCTQIAKLIKDGKAPRGSIAPVPIPAKGLWQLDVNDAIFQDVGLDDNDDGSTEPPLWLCNDQDKLVRLCATWDKHLPDFGVSTVTLPPWGPSAVQMVQCNINAHLADCGEDRHYGEETEGSDGEGDVGEEESGREDEDFATLDALERANIYHGSQDDHITSTHLSQEPSRGEDDRHGRAPCCAIQHCVTVKILKASVETIMVVSSHYAGFINEWEPMLRYGT
ncbi:hypothetical protein B0H13DRAFT_1879447 [Mycena leptocephala]|nr:hypothetical protein B0H13DRAFT_1879447 [Mycena leptocephala]